MNESVNNDYVIQKCKNQTWKISYIKNLGIVAQKVLADGLGNYHIISDTGTEYFFTFVDSNDNLVIIYRNTDNELIAQSNNHKTLLMKLDPIVDSNNDFAPNRLKSLFSSIEKLEQMNKRLVDNNNKLLKRIEYLETWSKSHNTSKNKLTQSNIKTVRKI